MKYLLAILIIASPVSHSVELILGGLSRHISGKTHTTHRGVEKLNNNHKAIGVGYSINRNYVSLNKYTNSFNTNSLSASYAYKINSLHAGVTVSNGYHQHIHTNMGRLMIFPSIKYNFKYITIQSIATAVIVSFRVEL